MSNLSGRIDLDSVPRQRIKDLLVFLELNPAVSTEVKKKDTFLSFRELSSGEQNRVSLAVKILAHAEDGLPGSNWRSMGKGCSGRQSR